MYFFKDTRFIQVDSYKVLYRRRIQEYVQTATNHTDGLTWVK